MTSRRDFLIRAAAVGVVGAGSLRIAHAAKADAGRDASKVARGGVVQTVLGPIDASKLGFTLTHEHVVPADYEAPGSRKTFSSRAISVADAVDKLKAARDAGINTVVDLSPSEAGRDVRFSEEVSRKSGMQIVVCTGQRLFLPELKDRTTQELTELFIKEIEQGIDGTGIKAGVIKAATVSDGGARSVTVFEERVLRAAARASKATGVPIETHSNSRLRGGIKQAEVFEAEGVSPARVSIGHSDDTDDMDYLIGLAKRGYTLGMDHAFWGMAPGASLPWKKRVESVKRLIDAGFVDRIFFSNDWVHGDVERDKVNPEGMLFTLRKTIPYLKQLGVSEQQIQAITIENPKRFFSRAAKRVDAQTGSAEAIRKLDAHQSAWNDRRQNEVAG
jgi:phosphotriesterase-related protein